MAPFGKYFLNSVVVMFFSVVCTTFTTILGAFAFSRLNFKGKEVIFAILISLMMIPFEMLIITNYTTIVKLKLYNTLPALVLPFISSIFYTYILKSFFDTVPNSIYYSARIDGSSCKTFIIYNCFIKCFIVMEFFYVAVVHYIRQPFKNITLRTPSFYNRSRFSSWTFNGSIKRNCNSNDYFVRFCKKIHCKRSFKGRVKRLIIEKPLKHNAQALC